MRFEDDGAALVDALSCQTSAAKRERLALYLGWTNRTG